MGACIKKWMVFVVLVFISVKTSAKDIYFCGEPIPVDNDFVAQKLMNVIRRQIPNVNMSALKQLTVRYFPFIEAYLRKYGIPQDFKYIPIVESGFRNLSSSAGARGFWQLMPADARDFNLVVNSDYDERDDPEKATQAACQLILRNYRNIKNAINYPSWVLTAAAYNFGIGNITSAVRKNGTDYFTMNLNAETAEYVYKIIAVKELFENPELYMSGFGVNVFKSTGTATKPVSQPPAPAAAPVSSDFSSLNIKVSKPGTVAPPKATKIVYIPAHIKKNPKKFKDGNLVEIELDKDLMLQGTFRGKGTSVLGTGWIIDDRVFINLGYGHAALVMDATAAKGIPVEKINKEGTYVLIKTEVVER